jgi:serine/threonine protein kinase
MDARAAQSPREPLFRVISESQHSGLYVRSSRASADDARTERGSYEGPITHAQRDEDESVSLTHVVQDDDAWASAWIGRILRDRYEIRTHVASGGMGHVFIAEHRLLGRHVAVKMLAPTHDRKLVRAFLREARALAGLEHPNIVHVSDLGRLHDGTYYLVMELLRGVPLSRWIERNGAMPAFRALKLLRKLASALDHCHQHGLVHRDIKPDNVMLRLDEDEDVTLIDFGIAYRPEKGIPEEERGLIMGTPLYMSPEQAFSLECSAASDIYSLGALTLELLTGEPTYGLGTPESVVVAVRNGLAPRMPSQLGLRVPGLDAIVHKALANHPRNRYATATAFIDAVERVLTASPEAAQATPRKRGSVDTPSREEDNTRPTTTEGGTNNAATLRLRLDDESGVRERPRKPASRSERRISIAGRPRALVNHWQFWALYGLAAVVWLAMA